MSNIVVFSNSLNRERFLNDNNDDVIRERLKKVAISEEVQLELEELMQVVEEYETQIKSAITSDLTEKQSENLVKHYLQSMDITKINPTALKKICEEALKIGDIDVSFIP